VRGEGAAAGRRTAVGRQRGGGAAVQRLTEAGSTGSWLGLDRSVRRDPHRRPLRVGDERGRGAPDAGGSHRYRRAGAQRAAGPLRRTAVSAGVCVPTAETYRGHATLRVCSAWSAVPTANRAGQL